MSSVDFVRLRPSLRKGGSEMNNLMVFLETVRVAKFYVLINMLSQIGGPLLSN